MVQFGSHKRMWYRARKVVLDGISHVTLPRTTAPQRPWCGTPDTLDSEATSSLLRLGPFECDFLTDGSMNLGAISPNIVQESYCWSLHFDRGTALLLIASKWVAVRKRGGTHWNRITEVSFWSARWKWQGRGIHHQLSWFRPTLMPESIGCLSGAGSHARLPSRTLSLLPSWLCGFCPRSF